MTVYVVVANHVETRPTECSYDDDGYYDDYYDEEFYSSETIAICATEEIAKAIADRENNKCGGWGDEVIYYPVEVLEEVPEDEEILYM